jgi:hypothetical protein
MIFPEIFNQCQYKLCDVTAKGHVTEKILWANCSWTDGQHQLDVVQVMWFGQAYIAPLVPVGNTSCFTRQTPSHPAHTSNLGKISTVPYKSCVDQPKSKSLALHHQFSFKFHNFEMKLKSMHISIDINFFFWIIFKISWEKCEKPSLFQTRLAISGIMGNTYVFGASVWSRHRAKHDI